MDAGAFGKKDRAVGTMFSEVTLTRGVTYMFRSHKKLVSCGLCKMNSSIHLALGGEWLTYVGTGLKV